MAHLPSHRDPLGAEATFEKHVWRQHLIASDSLLKYDKSLAPTRSTQHAGATTRKANKTVAAANLEGLLGEDVAQGVDADTIEYVLDDRLDGDGQVVHADASLSAGSRVQQRRLRDNSERGTIEKGPGLVRTGRPREKVHVMRAEAAVVHGLHLTVIAAPHFRMMLSRQEAKAQASP